jgi:RES domain-containing protein
VEQSRAWGITAEIHSSLDYAKTQDWAAAFARAGFDGICYFLRHDPAQRLTGIALFGPAGSPPGFPIGVSEPIGDDLIQDVAVRFGIRVVR